MNNQPTEQGQKKPSDKGAALPFIAVMIVLLLGMAAFAVDLGWLYVSGVRLQRAADSSSLAGVVFLPGDMPTVESSAIDGANANGWDIGSVNGTPISGGGPDDLEYSQLADNKLEVTLRATVPAYFLKVLGFDQFSISRTATAEYVKPVPIGSPDPCFGIGNPSIEGGDCNPATSQLFWAAISGPHTNKWNGDAYATRYWDDDSWNMEYTNTEYRPAGYYYAVDVPSGVSGLTVDVYDAGFYQRPNFNTETGDREQNSDGGADTHFQMYQFDDTPLDPTDNVAISGCSENINSGSSSSTYKNRWVNLCTFSGSVSPGIYVVRVWTDGNDGGTNQYSVRANTSGGPSARVYGINDISIFTNQNGATSTLHLAEVDPVHANKTLELRFYDPGEDNGTAYMTVEDPSGNTAQCDWESTDEYGNVVDSNSGNCRLKTSDSGTYLFQGLWVTALVEIPSNYTCTTDCWWKLYIENDNPHDRTTWAARIIGNPVRLVPNS